MCHCRNNCYKKNNCGCDLNVNYYGERTVCCETKYGKYCYSVADPVCECKCVNVNLCDYDCKPKYCGIDCKDSYIWRPKKVCCPKKEYYEVKCEKPCEKKKWCCKECKKRSKCHKKH